MMEKAVVTTYQSNVAHILLTSKKTRGLSMETRGNRSPYNPIPIKSSQPAKGDEDLVVDFDSIYRQLTIKSFLTLMEIIDPALLEFSRSVAHWTRLMAASLRFSPEDDKRVRDSSLLHDLGRMSVDRKIIEKEGQLTEQEWDFIRAHPVSTAKALSVFPYFGDIIPIVRHHHEWYDGTGYPDGLMGEDIPLMSRIIMIADAFVAMTSDRPYRPALKSNEALGVIEQNKGSQFDPKLVPLFAVVVSEDLESCPPEAEKQNPQGATVD